MSANRRDLAINLFRALARSVQAALVYPAGSERHAKSAQSLADAARLFGSTFRMTLVGDEAVVEEVELSSFSPVESLLLKTMHRAGWESFFIEPGLTAPEALEIGESLALARRPPLSGAFWGAGFLNLASSRRDGKVITNAAVGYLKLLADTKQSLYSVASGDKSGLLLAREVVEGIANHLDMGSDIFGSVRDLKRYDDYTFTHVLNVSMLTTAFARQLGAPRELVEAIGVGALLHDVGKINIPKEILNKPGALDERERAIMNMHPVESAKILMKFDPKVDPLAVVIAYQHHMAADGGGYPTRLPGQKPHPAVNLLSVADVFDAVRTDRPYSKALTPENAVNLILGRARQGLLHKGAVSVLVKLSGLTIRGKKVKLTTGEEATIERENPILPLLPLVTTDSGTKLDLAADRNVGIVSFGVPPQG